MDKEYHSSHHKGKDFKSGEAQFFSGLALTLAFGVVWYATKQFFWVFPFAFGGLIPLIKSLRYIIRKKRGIYGRDVELNIRAEKEILQIAKENRGKITPTLIALHSSLSLEKAEKLLEDIAKKGYASMQVTEDGRVEYEFPEFLPRNEG